MVKGEGPQFLAPVDHRRSGKSRGLLRALIDVCTSIKPPGTAYFLYPQNKKIREHIWDNPDLLQAALPMSQVARKDDQRMVVFFKSGWQLIFDGTDENPDKHRGGNGKIYILDEYDDQQKRVFSEIIRPIVEANGGVCVLSGTPRGVKHLHDAYVAGQDPDRPQWWSRLLPATQSTRADGTRLLSDLRLEGIKKDYTAEGIGGAYEQEYLCAFVQGDAQVFRRVQEITLDEHGRILKPEAPEGGKRYKIGSDPAITNDYWVNSVMDLHTHHEVFIERFQPMNVELGIVRTEALARKYNNAQVVLDTAGLGLPIYNDLHNRGVSVTPLNTGANKERLITNLASIVDSLTVRFLPDKMAMGEMRDFSFERLSTGRYRFQAPTGKHDDTVVARALVCWELPAPLPTANDPSVWNPWEDPRAKDLRVSNTFYGQQRNSRKKILK